MPLPRVLACMLQEQRSKLDERMMAAVVSSIKAAEVIIAVVDSGELCLRLARQRCSSQHTTGSGYDFVPQPLTT